MSARTLKVLAVVLILVASVGIDQVTKRAARARLADGRTQPVAGGLVVLRYVENQGAFLSLGARLSRPLRAVIFIAFPVVVLACMLLYLLRRGGFDWSTLAAFSLIVGGGAGNLIDRLLRDGRVTDFIVIGIGRVHTGIFNFADLSVLAGCLVLILSPAGTGLLRPGTGP